MQADAAGSLGTGLNLQGNTLDAVDLFSGDIDTNQTWRALNVPYRFDRLTIDSALTLSAGITLVGVSGAVVGVGQEGSLNAVGTPLLPIQFIGEQATAGYWQGIDFRFSNSVLNVLDNVVVSDAGGGGSPSTRGSIALDCNTSFPAQVSLSNTTVSNGVSWGVHVDTSGCSVNLGANVDVTGNALGGFNIAP